MKARWPSLSEPACLRCSSRLLAAWGSPRRLRFWISRSRSSLAIIVLLPLLVGGLGRGRVGLADELRVAVGRALMHACPLEVLLELRGRPGLRLQRAATGLHGLARDDARDRVVVEGAVASGVAQGL